LPVAELLFVPLVLFCVLALLLFAMLALTLADA
jgi:hypothetical protein